MNTRLRWGFAGMGSYSVERSLTSCPIYVLPAPALAFAGRDTRISKNLTKRQGTSVSRRVPFIVQLRRQVLLGVAAFVLGPPSAQAGGQPTVPVFSYRDQF